MTYRKHVIILYNLILCFHTYKRKVSWNGVIFSENPRIRILASYIKGFGTLFTMRLKPKEGKKKMSKNVHIKLKLKRRCLTSLTLCQENL